MQCSGSPEDKKRYYTDICLVLKQCIIHSLVKPSVYVCACTYMSEVFYRALCYISQLLFLMLFEMRDAFSDTMDNRSERKIYSWRKNMDLGLCLTTQQIWKMSFGMMIGFAICIDIFNLCTLSASPSDQNTSVQFSAGDTGSKLLGFTVAKKANFFL